MCPLGLIRNGRNMNYYDDKSLMKSLEDIIVENIRKQIDQIDCHTKVAICLGEGQNYQVLNKLNQKHHFFDTVLKLAHPRYIMQYKQKFIQTYIEKYIDCCQIAVKLCNEQ
ncbi:unnamed protein product [Didymodactylos carnosus]|uniref:Uracil-DNA glycosylase-like domain-containing protein n=1 Tax=Didymodactylos carnosus TaxID=1234261 RepID=A0A814UM14_9BILA|nr:unnamed protein product [Didymodactylos carnosus]CAF1330908.1 unnamed protein product [Didymodactylos carnosus]CAF3941588.1 unnamed protein product [Didymodactylos carnosus]CAF4142340.1 unnamed protein product [Didymodactylos carnosus]